MPQKKLPFKNIWVFLPCHNEADNLIALVKQILSLKIPDFHLVIVNDNSTDSTKKIAEYLNKKFPTLVNVFNRQLPKGRALAGKDAFLYCLKQGADVIIEMDADFSHDPKYIPQFLNKLSDPNIDVILGSRFLPGGSDTDRSPIRTLISRLSGIIFRLILGIKLTDMGSGFKAYKRQALESIDPQHLFSQKGLAISMESIFRVIKNGFRVQEIPIVFKDRRAGISKLSWKDFFEPIIICFKLIFNLGRFYEK